MIRKCRAMIRRICAVMLVAASLSMIPADKVMAVTSSGSIARGIDVSMHNGTVNWGQVANSGISFTFIKVGSTKSGVDPQFAANITGAQAAGLKTGIYLYSYATTPEQAANEANLVLQWIEPYTVNYPIVFDIEDKCHKNLTEQQLIDIINAFCTTIDAAGYYPMVYSNKNMFVQKLSITGWDKWVAQYNDTCEYNNNVCFWQYSSHGSVNGVGGRVDVNYQYKDYSSLIIPEGFIEHNGNVRFYRNWKMQKGWIAHNDTKYYLDGAGNLVRGWFTDASGTYYLSPQDGSIARGQCRIDGADHYFTADGIKTSGWVVLNDLKYFYDPANNGTMKREWLSDEKGNFYYFDANDGHMLTGAQVIGGKNYLFSPEGIRVTGMNAREDGCYYYDPATGEMVTGWFAASDKTYYADEAGHIVTGIYEIDGQAYYFDETGALVRNQDLELNGKAYHTTPEGVLTEVEAAQAGEGENAA
ncbi:MAG: hypothetical protein K2H52_05370 [Lachnospiraceae bacterium]|nr:hypothetical protein [Lachnospiraceae bacterium]